MQLERLLSILPIMATNAPVEFAVWLIAVVRMLYVNTEGLPAPLVK